MGKKREHDFFDLEDMEMENDCLTPKECMNYLYIGKSTFYKLVNSGELPAFRIGKLWRVPKSGLQDFIRKNM